MQCKGAWCPWDWKAICLKKIPIILLQDRDTCRSMGQFHTLSFDTCTFYAESTSDRKSTDFSSQTSTIRMIFVWPWKMVSVRVRYLFYQPMDEKIKTWTLRFPAKENLSMEKALFDWPVVLQFDVKAKYRFISRKFFGHEVFSPERSLNQPKSHARLYPFDKSIKSLYFRSFVVSVLFARIHFKVIRKSLYP